MIKTRMALLILVASLPCHSTEYVGKIGSIDVTASFSQGEYEASYMYNKFRTPIKLIKSDNNSDAQLIFIEKTGKVETAAFNLKSDGKSLSGFWINKKTGQKLPVTLNAYNDARGELQSDSFKNSYFRISCNDNGKVVTIIDKKTDSDITRITADGMCRHNELEVGDYNFDGFKDFSVFESFYAGPNTSRLYYLYNPKNKKHLLSDQLSLVSLFFDPVEKTVTSTNQCCAGSVMTIDTYKWQGATLKLINGECYMRNEEGEEIKKPRKACD